MPGPGNILGQLRGPRPHLMGSGRGQCPGDAEGLLSEAHRSLNSLLKISFWKWEKGLRPQKEHHFLDTTLVPPHQTGWGAPRPVVVGGVTASGPEPAPAPSSAPQCCTCPAPRPPLKSLLQEPRCSSVSTGGSPLPAPPTSGHSPSAGAGRGPALSGAGLLVGDVSTAVGMRAGVPQF